MSDLYYFKSLEGIVHNTDTLKFLLKLNKTYGYKVFSQQYSKSQWAESDIDVVESIFIDDNEAMNRNYTKVYFIGQKYIPTAFVFTKYIEGKLTYFFGSANVLKHSGYNRNIIRSVDMNALIKKIGRDPVVPSKSLCDRLLNNTLASQIVTDVCDVKSLHKQITNVSMFGMTLKHLIEVAIGRLHTSEIVDGVKKLALESLDKIERLEQTAMTGFENIKNNLMDKGFYMIGINRLAQDSYVVGKVKVKDETQGRYMFTEDSEFKSVRNIDEWEHSDKVIPILTMYKIQRDDYIKEQDIDIHTRSPYHLMSKNTWNQPKLNSPELGVLCINFDVHYREFNYQWIVITDVQ
jgi:hypothetical protein